MSVTTYLLAGIFIYGNIQESQRRAIGIIILQKVPDNIQNEVKDG